MVVMSLMLFLVIPEEKFKIFFKTIHLDIGCYSLRNGNKYSYIILIELSFITRLYC